MTICTIVIPTHNRDDLLVRAVQSALQACPADGEVLVVDDKSIVPAAQVLAAETDPRLRVIVNTGPKGAASTRNLGVSSASGDVVFFLDDDDEILPGYCERVLCPDGPASNAEWGFSSILVRQQGVAVDIWRQRKRIKRGVVPSSARVRDIVAATGDGFWIRKERFERVGAFDPEQIIDEDTDLCVRLLGLGLCPWYEPEPGMLVYRGISTSGNGGQQLTSSTPDLAGLKCYFRTFERNVFRFDLYSPVRWFLATRYIRRSVRTLGFADSVKFALRVGPALVSGLLCLYVLVKSLAFSARLYRESLRW